MAYVKWDFELPTLECAAVDAAKQDAVAVGDIVKRSGVELVTGLDVAVRARDSPAANEPCLRSSFAQPALGTSDSAWRENVRSCSGLEVAFWVRLLALANMHR